MPCCLKEETRKEKRYYVENLSIRRKMSNGILAFSNKVIGEMKDKTRGKELQGLAKDMLKLHLQLNPKVSVYALDSKCRYYKELSKIFETYLRPIIALPRKEYGQWEICF